MKTGEEESLFKDTGLFEAEKQAVLDSLYEIKETEAEFDDDGQEVKPACSYAVRPSKNGRSYTRLVLFSISLPSLALPPKNRYI